MQSLCNTVDAGRREGFILVGNTPPIEAPPQNRTNRRRAGGNGRAGNGRATLAAKKNGGRLTVTDANGDSRRAELADFLKARRAALQPADVGLPGCGRRRTPGLRREEVAQLAGVGTTWYTWLEQGRDVKASLSVFEALAAALRMSAAERAHLIMLGRGEQAPPLQLARERVTPTMRRLVENLGPNPAALLGRRWDYLAWNDAFSTVFGDLSLHPPEERNTIWLMFMDPARREVMPDWEISARRLLARFRADHARHLGDPSFDDLVQALLRASPDFCRWWSRHEVLGSGEGRKTLIHPTVGRLEFEHALFKHGEDSDHRLVLYSPLPEHDTAAKLASLLGGR
jgi:transcriptional regulator with XRE-family HTH domain